MGIYLPNIEMPETCGKCKIKNIIECDRWKRVRSIALDRHRDCPLIPIPEHVRLVNAEYIESENDRFFDLSRANEEFDEHASAYAYSLIANILANAPTIIPKE